MKRKFPVALLGVWLVIGCIVPALARAAETATGSVEGRVFNAATGQYVRNAEIRVQGTDRVTYSQEGGRYRFVNVPPGALTLVVNYAGYPALTSNVSVAAGQTVGHDLELAAPAPGSSPAGSTVQLGQYVVSAEREGNAKAIME